MSVLLDARRCAGLRPRLRITIVLLGRTLHGGVRVVATYGNRLIDRGHDVTIACLRRPLPRRPKALLRRLYRDMVSRTGRHRDHLHDFKGPVVSVPANRLDGALPDADVVLATHWLTAASVVALPACKGRKYYFVQGYEVESFDPELVDATWRLPMRKIVISRWLQDLARSRFGDSGVVLIPNAVDTRLFDAPPRAMQHPPRVGFMYAREPAKGVPTATQAIELVRRKLPELRVICLSMDKPDRAAALPPRCEFHFRPPQERIRHIYASADVWLLPSVSEGFGLPGLEAMACRCPVVSTRCGGPADYVDDGVNGFLVDVGDSTAMAERVLTLLSDPPRWERMSRAAYEVRLRFDWDRSADLLEEVLAN